MCDQLVHNSQIGWHQGEVLSVTNLLVCLRACGRQFSSGGSASCKNNLGMWVRPLSISFRELGVRGTLLRAWVVYSLNCYQSPGPTAICFYIFTFPNH